MSDLTISIIQTDLFWEDKTANLEMFERKIMGISEKTEVIILPEMFTTGFSMRPKVFAETMDGYSVEWMKRIAAQKKAILTGSLIIEEDGLYYNRLIWMLPNGVYGHYDKRHCFSLAGEDEHYCSGAKRLIASVKGWRINLCICYDLRFPVWTRQVISEDIEQPEYDLLVYVANWPDRRVHAWRTLLPARAIENQCFVVGVNRVGHDGNGVYHSGYSLISDPLGEVCHLLTHEEGIITTTLVKKQLDDVRTQMPFWKDGDPFLII
jgi:predicted amidohydrolase